MRAFMIIGVLLLVLGVASIFVPIRYRERHGIDAGPISIGVTTTEHREVPPVISGALIIAGAAMTIAGARKLRR